MHRDLDRGCFAGSEIFTNIIKASIVDPSLPLYKPYHINLDRASVDRYIVYI
jgi:hypothetical protein